jgi:hypothetical protein
MVVKRAYPDTPVAMHYRPFKEIDWRKLLGADEVVLVITPVFLREVDEHKNHKRGALQQRARRMNTWLAELRRTKSWEIRPGVRVEVNTREPELDVDFAARGLQPSVNDDKIVACMVRDAVVHAGVPFVCVTSDNALGYKVDGAGIHAASTPNIKAGALHVTVEVREGPFRFFRSKLGRPEPEEDEEEAASEEESTGSSGKPST